MAINNTVTSVTSLVRGLISDKLRTDGRDSFAYKSDNVFYLSEDFPSSSTIKVFKNGTEVSENDWDYSADNNSVTIVFVTSGESLSSGDIILIKYSYYKKYSDAEIKGYLESALAYFPQYKYKKTFEINSDDEIIAVDDANPTKEEIYFISIITSILIDPQNIDIQIPDLRLSAKRNKSDQEQIQEAFTSFSRFFGSISFKRLDYKD